MRKFILATLLAGTLGAPAAAQEASPFTGFRVEGIGGYDILKSGNKDDDGTDTSDDEGDESIEGALYGVGVGFDFDLGGLVAGVEGEFSESTGKQEFDETLDAPFSGRIKTGRDLYIGGRLGVRAAPSTLIYGKAGYTNTKVDARFEDVGTLANTVDFDDKVDGWRLGAGVEQLFGPNAYGKLEYRYSKYGDLEFNNSDLEADIDLDRHQVVAAIGFRF
jgi:outer membrane immunogenic protein